MQDEYRFFQLDFTRVIFTGEEHRELLTTRESASFWFLFRGRMLHLHEIKPPR